MQLAVDALIFLPAYMLAGLLAHSVADTITKFGCNHIAEEWGFYDELFRKNNET